MERIDATDARRSFAALCRKVAFGKKRIVIDFHGKPLAAMVSVEDLDRLTQANVPTGGPDTSGLEECLVILRRARRDLEAGGVRHASIFGSVSRGEAGPGSDVDVLVELEPKAQVGFVQFINLRDRLNALLKRDVDLVSVGSLDRKRDASIFRDAKKAF